MSFDQTKHLKKVHKLRRQRTINCVERTINQLRAENQPINFSRVAKHSGVGKSTLYSIPKLKEKIDFYREESFQKNYNLMNSSTKKDIMIRSLKRRIAVLEKENKTLNNQLKHVYGELFESTIHSEVES
ncbi:DUF6262 family protein [Enterococcus faecalis]|uniref:Transposase n=1 Tax=Enterococcus faecalis TaxID=1351 RepID=A0A1W6QXK8_ENTFL|nr:DUF6262 family protein [Enterococcus faecalis]ARO46216.1 transposase [Enterococcus faecalis]MCB8493114.1 transposase [Enterococcus faecalis]MEB7954566.1 DUF6262 family protein [Enterococcus faecalis]MEB7964697.1 DUF6262 family protein [Enterococcus faecalis]